MVVTDLGFPLGVRLTHWFNVLFLTLLVRSGLAILSAHPKLYWNGDSRPGSEWLRFTRKELPTDRLWCSSDEEARWPSWLSLPGGEALGLGRYWHFTSAICWTVTGLIYVLLLFISPQWQRLVPTSWKVVPDAFQDLWMYLTLRTPPPGTPYGPSPFNPLQQLAYFGLVFIVTPLQILTGLAQSPSLLARFPWYGRLFGNRQGARSLHFLGLVAFASFLVIHLTMVVWHGVGEELGKIVLGESHSTRQPLAIGLGLAILSAIALVHVAANVLSTTEPHTVHRLLAGVVDPVRTLFLHRNRSVQSYEESGISPFFRVNGYPPIMAYPQAKGDDDAYERLLADQFASYRLKVHGLIRTPLEFSMDDLRAMPRQEQITMHNCIQGWTSIGKWSGVLVGDLLDRCQLDPDANYLVFRSFGNHEKSGKPYYECIDVALAYHPQTILAFELNGEPLPIQHGAPLRLRVETKLGFKMVKFLREIEVVASVRQIGQGMGGVREDEQQYGMGAEI